MTTHLLPFSRGSLLLIAVLFLAGGDLHAQEPGGEPGVSFLPSWNFMSLSTARVDSFLLQNPSYDGRGVVVLIFDTGVDPSIPGLGMTSTGTKKVIDLVDVSGSNVVECLPAEREGDSVLSRDLGIVLHGLSWLHPRPYDSTLRIGVIDEAEFVNAGVSDFNGDGDSRSRFGLLLYNSEKGPRVVVDADLDRHLKEEKVMTSYHAGREAIIFPQDDPEKSSPMTLGPTLLPDGRSVSFHYDMNGHGTHVAGIVGGYAINDEPGFNGVAPGVEIISVKFSSDQHNDLTITGTMKAAYEYAAELADSLEREGKPVVVNMSFGIGSAYEGSAPIEIWLNRLLAEHPNLYVVTSAGNSGPGLSTVGIPSAGSQLITVGAALPVGIGRDSYGAALERDVIWDFSSRGGEVDKPDVIAPGTAISTIPRFSHNMRASGTSMASPYVAGVVSLILSAAAVEYPGWVPGQGLIRRLLRASARPMEANAPIEQGGGMVDVIAAWETLKRWKKSGYADDFQEYSIETFSPGYPDGKGPAAYWRSGWLPEEEYRQEFTIKRFPMEAYSDGAGTEFFRPYTLESTVPWMKPIQQNVYIRGDGDADVEVLYDREKLREPGLYSGRVVARRGRGTRKTARDEVEFELVNTIIVPHRLNAADGFRATTEVEEIRAGELQRHFLAIPSGALAVRLTLQSESGSKGKASATIVDRHGKTQTYLPRVDPKERPRAGSLIPVSDLGDGVIEIVVKTDPMEGSGGKARYSLEMEALMLDVATETYDPGGDAEAELIVTLQNSGTEMMEGTWEYTVKGYERKVRDTISSAELYRRPVTLDAHDGALWLSVTFPPEEYQRSTDILLRLVDSAGYIQAEEAMGAPSEWLFLPNFLKDGVARGYFLEIVFGATYQFSDTTKPVTFTILERHVRPTEGEKIGSRVDRKLYPFVPRTLRAPLPKLKGGIPSGYLGVGELTYELDGREEEQVVMEFLFAPAKQ